jgi:hypothetical protein
MPMSDDDRLQREHYQILSNAGRCDWCGKPIDMESGDTLTLITEEEMGNEDHDISPQQAADAIADALEGVGGPKDAMLADEIRDSTGYRLHDRCFEDSSLPELHTEPTEEDA